MHRIKKSIKKYIKQIPIMKSYFYRKRIYNKMVRAEYENNFFGFCTEYRKKILEVLPYGSKVSQIQKLLDSVDIEPIDNGSFLYTIDCFKTIYTKKCILDNYMIDYSMVVQHSFAEIRTLLAEHDNEFSRNELQMLSSLEKYYERYIENAVIVEKFQKQLSAISSVFKRPAESFFEGLQRILFYNQLLWQTGHTLNGLGRLDVILGELYDRDISTGRLTRNTAKVLLQDFFFALHNYYWFKSGTLMGDTGQIIILGGKLPDGSYFRNDLTDLFIDVAKELKLPDPKILLRCTADMPEDLLEKAMNCIATGIGAPLLSNDDIIIPALISDGYQEADAYQYGTSACWEPLIPGITCDQNNIASLNFAEPFKRMLEDRRFENCDSMNEIIEQYKEKLIEYIKDVLDPLSQLQFEDDPLIALVSLSAIEKQMNITRGGGKYNNLGLTTVGLGTTVNSLLVLQKLVFEEKRYTLSELNELRRKNFDGNDELLKEMKEHRPCYGCDDLNVLMLVKDLIDLTSQEFKKHHTFLGGHFKFGLSSPYYITGAKSMCATFDGRKDGEPFSVHISASSSIPTTELLSFARKLDYKENKINGNVVDLIVSPRMLNQNLLKYTALLRAAFAGGIFQVQMNVVDSKTLIAAKENPEKFPQLVVRVWGFSAYFNDLPEEYKDVLIVRALENEKAA